MIAARFEQWRDRALKAAERRLPALTRYRQAEALPIRLHARRIYIIPSGFGVFALAVVVTMLLGALNFNNNAALLFTFVLAGVLLASLPGTVAELDTLQLSGIRALPVHAGDPATLQLEWTSGSAFARERLRLSHGDQMLFFGLDGAGGSCNLQLPTERRGWLPVGRFTLACEQSFGLFRAWSVLHPAQSILVYARAESTPPPLPRSNLRNGMRLRNTPGDEWHGLREYRSGDPRRSMAWKSSARHERMLVNEYGSSVDDEVVLDWHALADIDYELRISRLTRWVRDAERSDLEYKLVLPRQTLGPARGEEHAQRCLRELALLP